MKTTIFTQDISIGKLDGENVKLAAPSWDCGWYWGFGYIKNRNLHTHFNSFYNGENINLKDAIEKHFTEWKLNEKDTWTFCELIKTMYSLKETAEVLGRGGSYYTSNPCKDIIINKDEVDRINNIVLPAIFDAIYVLFNK